MTRIKSDNVHLGGSFVVPIEQSLSSAKLKEVLAKEEEIISQGIQKAQKLIENAQVEAQDILQQAQAQALSEVDGIKAQAYEEGFEAGRSEGFENIKEELKNQILSVENFAKSKFDVKKAIIKSAHLDIINLIIEISQKVCYKSLELDENVLKEITKNAIRSLKDKENITIIVNPEMAEKIYSISDELKEQIPQLSSIKIIEDNSVSPDGTIVESPLSRVDSRIKSQIDELAEKLMAQLNSTSDEELMEEIQDVLEESKASEIQEIQEIEESND